MVHLSISSPVFWLVKQVVATAEHLHLLHLSAQRGQPVTDSRCAIDKWPLTPSIEAKLKNHNCSVPTLIQSPKEPLKDTYCHQLHWTQRQLLSDPVALRWLKRKSPWTILPPPDWNSCGETAQIWGHGGDPQWQSNYRILDEEDKTKISRLSSRLTAI